MILTQAAAKVSHIIAFPKMPLCQVIKLYSRREDKTYLSMTICLFTKIQKNIYNCNCMLQLEYERKSQLTSLASSLTLRDWREKSNTFTLSYSYNSKTHSNNIYLFPFFSFSKKEKLKCTPLIRFSVFLCYMSVSTSVYLSICLFVHTYFLLLWKKNCWKVASLRSMKGN